MNDAHLHMVLNHFPILGSIFGLVILISGIILNHCCPIKNFGGLIFPYT